MLEQIRMRTCALKSNSTLYRVDFINKNPVTLNMAVTRSFPFTVNRMIAIFRRQGLFISNHVNNFAEFANIPPLFFHQLVLFPEDFCINRLKHGLIVQIVRVVPIKVFKHLINRLKPAQSRRYLARQHIFNFLHTLVNLRLIARISSLRVEVRGANGARVRMDVFVGSSFSSSIWRPLVYSRGKSKNDRSRWNFAGHVNDQPMAGRYLYSLRNGHALNIA